MRLREILGAEVRDGNDRRLGVVRDVRATVDQDEDGSWRAVSVDGIIVAPRWKLRTGVDRPLLLGWVERRYEREARFVRWDHIQSTKDRVVRVRLSPQ